MGSSYLLLPAKLVTVNTEWSIAPTKLGGKICSRDMLLLCLQNLPFHLVFGYSFLRLVDFLVYLVIFSYIYEIVGIVDPEQSRGWGTDPFAKLKICMYLLTPQNLNK